MRRLVQCFRKLLFFGVTENPNFAYSESILIRRRKTNLSRAGTPTNFKEDEVENVH